MGTLGHVVIQPNASPHRTLRLVADVELLLAATIASVRMNRPAVVFEAPASLAACPRCQEAYAEARKGSSRMRAGSLTSSSAGSA
jgi:hypothetical protein